MNDFSKWIMSVLAVAIIGFAVDLFLGETRMAKFVRVATAAITLLLIVTPIPSLISDGALKLENFTFTYEFGTDQRYQDYIVEQKRVLLASSLKRALAKNGLKNAAVEVNGEEDEIFIEINLSDCVIDEKIEHINKNELALSVVCEETGIDESRVTVYG